MTLLYGLLVKMYNLQQKLLRKDLRKLAKWCVENKLKQKLIQIVRPKKQSYFGLHDIEVIRYLTQLRVKFSDLCEHRFRHNFHCLSPLCICGNGEENNEHFLLHCPRYVNQCKDYLDKVSNLVGLGIFELASNDLGTLLL